MNLKLTVATVTINEREVPLTAKIARQIPGYPFNTTLLNTDISVVGKYDLGQQGGEHVLLNTKFGLKRMSQSNFINTGIGAGLGYPPEKYETIPHIILLS